MRILAETSGWSFKEWKRSSYPRGMPDAEIVGLSQLPVSRRGGERHLLPRAQGEGAAGLGRAGTGLVPGGTRLTMAQRPAGQPTCLREDQ
jgi:hypothetical protein